MSEELERTLTGIDNYYSRKYHLSMLKFLAQAIVSYGQLESCKSVPEVYKKISSKCSDYHIAAALLRHMLRVTGYKKKETLQILDAHCSEAFDLATVAPSLPFYELLLLLARQLHKNNNYEPFLQYIDESKLNKSKHDVSSPVDLLQSMICKGTIDPNNICTLKEELITPLNDARMFDEAQFMQCSVQPGKLDS